MGGLFSALTGTIRSCSETWHVVRTLGLATMMAATGGD